MKIHRLFSASTHLSTLQSKAATEYADFLREFAEQRMAYGNTAALLWYDANVMDLHARVRNLHKDSEPHIAVLS